VRDFFVAGSVVSVAIGVRFFPSNELIIIVSTIAWIDDEYSFAFVFSSSLSEQRSITSLVSAAGAVLFMIRSRRGFFLTGISSYCGGGCSDARYLGNYSPISPVLLAPTLLLAGISNCGDGGDDERYQGSARCAALRRNATVVVEC
jgi:hypothetical protein